MGGILPFFLVLIKVHGGFPNIKIKCKFTFDCLLPTFSRKLFLFESLNRIQTLNKKSLIH